MPDRFFDISALDASENGLSTWRFRPRIDINWQSSGGSFRPVSLADILALISADGDVPVMRSLEARRRCSGMTFPLLPAEIGLVSRESVSPKNRRP